MHAERQVRVWQKCCHVQLDLQTDHLVLRLGGRKIYLPLGGGAER
jgi:hypothetical protein